MTHAHLNLVDGQVRRSKVSQASPTALERRLAHQRTVISMGITPDVLSDIVDLFYKRVRAHPVLAPVFVDKVGDDWTHHLKKMKSFWISVALNSGTYSGKPVVIHRALTTVGPAHFGIWLGLFRQTVQDITGNDEAAAFLNDKAAKMAANFRRAMGLEGE